MAYGNDGQHSHAEKDASKEIPLGCAVSCFDISESQYQDRRMSHAAFSLSPGRAAPA